MGTATSTATQLPTNPAVSTESLPTTSATASNVTPLPTLTQATNTPDEPTASLTATVAALSQRIESDSSAVERLGKWTVQASKAASGGYYVYSSGSPSDSLILTFQGSSLDIFYVKHPALGSFAVEIDGQTLLTVKATASSSVFGVRAEVRNLPSGSHKLRIFPTSGVVAIDSFGVESLTRVDVKPTSTPTIKPSPTPRVELLTLTAMTLTLTAIPDQTARANLTLTPTGTAITVQTSATATNTATSLPLPQLKGQVKSVASLSSVTITLVGTGLRQTTPLQNDGTFELALSPGSYQLTITALYHLPYVGQVVLTDQPLILPTITLFAGDIDGDGVIDMKDAQLVIQNFGRTAPPAPLAADVNGDGIVNIYDLVLVSANMKANK